ncbi:MAG: hypothetical protein POH28_01835 [Acidocella sp.]|nr:hypothetical protein [Acidocella sp.]
MRHAAIAPAALALSLLAGSAFAQPVIQSQEGIALENQILQLQQQVQQLQSNSGGGGSSLGGAANPPPASNNATPPAGGMVASLLNQVGQLQSQVQQLNGQIDTLQNQVNTQHDATEKEIGDLKFQMTNGGATAATQPAAPAEPAAPPAAPQATASTTPHALLLAAQDDYDKHHFPAAEAAARSLLSTDKTAPEAYRAQYILAQALAADGKPQDAAIAYDDAYNRNRTGAEAAPSLLGLASSLAAINQNEAACDTISSLNSQFPTPPAGLAPRIAAVSQRAHCS